LPLLDVPQGLRGPRSAAAGVKISDFEWLQGNELMTYYESSPGFRRGFCRVCGSPIINGSPAHPERGVGLALGTLDTDP